MKTLIVALGLALAGATAAAAALAQMETILPAEAQAHVGQTVTVEGAVSAVRAARSGITFIDVGGTYPDNAFAAVIFKDDTGKFPNVAALNGKTVDISGPVRLYKGKPEIVVNDPAQIKTK